MNVTDHGWGRLTEHLEQLLDHCRGIIVHEDKGEKADVDDIERVGQVGRQICIDIPSPKFDIGR